MILFWVLYLFFLGASAEQMGSLRMPNEIQNANLEDKAGAQIPLDINLVDQDGQKIILEKYFAKEANIPVILTLGYYGCPMLCSLVLNGLVEALKKISLTAGVDYKIISISIDPKEQPSLANKKQQAYINSLGVENSSAWAFHVSEEAEIKKLASILGFNYYFDKKQNQYAHGAGFFVLSPQGILSRTFFGINFLPRDIKLALQEASEGKIGSFIDKIILSCFHYDPDSQKYGVYILGVMRLFGILTILTMAIWLMLYFRAEKKQLQKPLGF